jgi:4-alpha-glucanotransferase
MAKSTKSSSGRTPAAPAAPAPSTKSTALFNWLTRRSAGVLLHPTCLPGDQGIGTFDGAVDTFLDFLKEAGFSTWQICPLGPTGYGDSPYQCFSAFAGNPYLIDLKALVSHGLLPAASLDALRALPRAKVDFGALYQHKWKLLFHAHERYVQLRPALPYGDFEAFKKAQASWLEGYAYFRALKDHHQGRPWNEWPADLRSYASALKSPLRKTLAAQVEAHAFTQYLFFGQWARVREAAARRGIQIIGDIPIFVAFDSADVWANPGLFEIDPVTFKPHAVAGVPPDYFAADGQLWGNPLYRWDVHKADGYAWWLSRLKASFDLCDIVRIDHFRGFDAYWRVPYPAENARKGEWVPGPGLDLFKAVKAAFPDARIIAEDLGVLTDTVVALREDTGLPGMNILQFAFGTDATNAYLPHNLIPNSVIYPGTHDNDTTLGWYASAAEKEKDHARRYLRIGGSEIGWDFLRTAYASVSRMAVVPLQDILNLGPEGRFNLPGKPDGNWQWRYLPEHLAALRGGTTAYLASLADLTGRSPAVSAGSPPR